jgi:hypothetical protein
MKYYHLKKGTYLSSLLLPTLWHVNILLRLIPTKTRLPKQYLPTRILSFQFRPLVLKLHSCVLHTGLLFKFFNYIFEPYIVQVGIRSISRFHLFNKQFKHILHSTNQQSQTSIQIIMSNSMSIVQVVPLHTNHNFCQIDPLYKCRKTR